MAKLVSKTYGDALFEVAMETGRMEEFFEEAKGIIIVLQENTDLTKLMDHPKIVKEEKAEILENIFAGKVSAEIIGLMRMIVEKDHFKDMENVFSYFVHRVKEYKNIGVVHVTAAMDLSESQKEAVVKRLLETTKYVELEMHYEVDKALIGGMVIRIGDRVVDSSIRTKLRDLSRELSKIQLKVGECAP